MDKQTSGFKLQVKFNWIVLLCFIILFPVLIGLGIWQLDRAQLKRQIQTDRDNLQSENPIPIESLNLQNSNKLDYTKVILNGSYDNEKIFLISNQVFQNRPGYEVITLFMLESSANYVLVSRGWVAANFDINQLPHVEPIYGQLQLSGEIHTPSNKSFFLPQEIQQPLTWPIKLHHLDINEINKLFKNLSMPLLIRLDENTPGVLDRHWKVQRLMPENSTSYAIQWFAMALMLLIISIIKSTNIMELINPDK